MQALMPPVDTTDNQFHDGDPVTGVEGTIVPALHLNNVQSAIRDIQTELISMLTAAGMSPDSASLQILNALKAIFQAKDTGLTSLAALVGGANKLPYYTAADVFSQTDLTSVGRDILGKTTAALVLQYLAGAPLASPTFTGDPKAPTPASGDNGTSIATTAFVQSTFSNIGLNQAMQTITNNFDWQTATFASGQSYVAATTNWLNAPSGLTFIAGDTVVINVVMARTTSRYVVSVASQQTSSVYKYQYMVVIDGAAGSRTFGVEQVFTSAAATVVPIANGGTGAASAPAALTALGATPLASFVYSLVQNGYAKLPGGLIIQWGQATGSLSATVPVTFPIPFPTALLSTSLALDLISPAYATLQSQTSVGISINTWDSTGARAALALRYIAIGY